MSVCFSAPSSVTMVEGTVSSLLEEEDGCVTGVQYKDKETGDTKVSTSDLSLTVPWGLHSP